jgi:membrane protease subunit (stomatin/prohibitin family)
MKSEFLHALQPAFARLSAMGLRPSAIPAHTAELAAALDEALSDKWQNLRGLKLGTVAINSITLPEEDAQMIRDLQRTSVMRDTSMAGATIVTAQADAMRLAASNEGGAMMGFMGLNMAQQAGGMNAQELLMAGQAARTAAPAPVGGAASGWACSCGVNNTGRFCSNCGSAQPAPAGSWTCSCGVTNSGRFCSDCGSAQPANDNWNCNCGAANTGRFCSECGGPRN